MQETLYTLLRGILNYGIYIIINCIYKIDMRG